MVVESVIVLGALVVNLRQMAVSCIQPLGHLTNVLRRCVALQTKMQNELCIDVARRHPFSAVLGKFQFPHPYGLSILRLVLNQRQVDAPVESVHQDTRLQEGRPLGGARPRDSGGRAR